MNDYRRYLPDGVEARFTPISEFRVDEEQRQIEGHAATFSEPYDVGPFKEQVAPGAFADSIAEDDVRSLFNHDPNFPLGRNKAGTLELSEDETGLLTRTELPESATRVKEAIERGDVDQMSFGFTVEAESWEDLEDGTELRTIEKARLWDVSVVTFPANPNTDVALRRLERYREHRDRIEEEEPVEATEDVAEDTDTEENEGQPVELLRRRLDLAELEH